GFLIFEDEVDVRPILRRRNALDRARAHGSRQRPFVMLEQRKVEAFVVDLLEILRDQRLDALVRFRAGRTFEVRKLDDLDRRLRIPSPHRLLGADGFLESRGRRYEKVSALTDDEESSGRIDARVIRKWI